MPITPLPTPPSRQDPATFSDRADAHVAALQLFTTEANQLEEDVNADEVSAAASKNAAEAAEALAEQYKDMASSTANFKGDWDDLTGAATIPYSVIHDSVYYQLLNDITDITASEPGVTSDWTVLHDNYTVKDDAADSSPGYLAAKVGKYRNNKNLIINPNMVVNQEEYVEGTVAAVDDWVADMFKVVSSDGLKKTSSGESITLDNSSSAADLGVIKHWSDDIASFPDGTVFTVSANVTAITGGAFYFHGMGCSVSTTSTGVLSATFTKDTDSSAGWWDDPSLKLSLGIGAVVTFDSFKLEVGEFATEYEVPQITEEESKCSRYLLILSGVEIGTGYGTLTGGIRITVDTPVIMRSGCSVGAISGLTLIGQGTTMASPTMSSGTVISNNKVSFELLGSGPVANELYVVAIGVGSIFRLDARP